MLWYEQLYLMLLTARAEIALDLGDGFQERSRTLPEKRRVWWSLVRHLSRFDARERQRLQDEVQAQLEVNNDWSSEILTGPLRGRFLMLNAAEVRSLAAAGMEVGAHTLTHPLLSQLPAEAAWTEIAESRARLEQLIGRPVWALAYPFGDEASATEREGKMAERAGFGCAFLNVGEWLRSSHAAVCDAPGSRYW